MLNAASTFSQIQPSGLRRIVLRSVQWPVATSEVVKGVKVIWIHVWIQYLHCVIWLTGRPSFSSWTQRKMQRQRGWLVLQAVVVAARVRHFLCPPQKPQKLQSAKGVKTDNSCIVGRNIRHRKCHERIGQFFFCRIRAADKELLLSWCMAFVRCFPHCELRFVEMLRGPQWEGSWHLKELFFFLKMLSRIYC